MSTLVTQTVQSKTSGPPVFKNSSGTEKGQLVKAWCKWHTSGGADIDDSFNVTSVDDNGTGKSFVNWSNNFSNNDYAIVANGQEDSGSGGRMCIPKSPTTDKSEIEFRNTSNSLGDAINLWCIAIGD